MFNFGIKQIYTLRWERQWLKVEYEPDGAIGWLWRNLNAFDEERATWIAMRPLS